MATGKEQNFDKSIHDTKWLYARDLSVVWAQSQRPCDKRWAQKIADEYDPELFGEIAVSLPNGNGHYHVVDGQHRLAAIRIMFENDWETQRVPCHIFDATTPVEAAALFSKLNSMRKRPQPIDLFRVAVTAGAEPAASVFKILKAAGYKVSNAKQDSCVAAVAAPVAVYEKYGGDNLRFTLNVIQLIWGRDPDAVTANIIRGFGAFVSEWPHANWSRLVERVSKSYTPGRFEGGAKTLREGMPRSTSSVDAHKELLRRTYNQGLTPKSKIALLLDKAERKLAAQEADEARSNKRDLEAA